MNDHCFVDPMHIYIDNYCQPPLETVLQAVAALVAVAQLDPCFFTENSEAAFKGKDTKLYPDCAKGGGGGFRYPTVLERYKVRRHQSWIALRQWDHHYNFA